MSSIVAQSGHLTHSAIGVAAVADAFLEEKPIIEAWLTAMKSWELYGRALSGGHPI
jgi:hypothetical protein